MRTSALRLGSEEAWFASFGLACVIYLLSPAQIGVQDLSALLDRPQTAEAPRRDLGSPFSAIRVAAFNLPRPVGTDVPAPPTLRIASLIENANDDIVGSINSDPRANGSQAFPIVNRAGKGDRLVPAVAAPEPAAQPEK